MKLFHLGSKIKGFATSLGNKIYSGSKYIGQKVYDNRYKIAGATVGLAAAAAGSKLAYDKAAPQISQMRGAIDTYSQISNPAEREGFKEQFKDVISENIKKRAGSFSDRATNMLFNPYTAKLGRQNTSNDNWD